MSSEDPKLISTLSTNSIATTEAISAIVPARNEEGVIGACVESLARQPEITAIIVVNDESTDRTADIVRELMLKIPHLRLLDSDAVTPGWIGKNHAAALGAKDVTTPWLLFTDADAEHQPGAARRALQLAKDRGAALVSFSPEQVAEKWYEKSLIPFIYCRLARRFSFDAVNDPSSPAAAANGQFLMIRRDAYLAIGGHASVAGEVLEDVALAKRLKSAGYRLWFGLGQGAVRVRMYRSFDAMWEGWKKNLYVLMGGTPWATFRELESAFPWIPLLVLSVGIKLPIALLLGVWLLIFRQMNYGSELKRNQFPFALIIYYVPAVLLYAGALWASYRAHVRGKVAWKGREYAVGVPGTIR
ncbi:MAG TPA: glycosyltransferase family 2 protein [Candidatus Dormibacteraeota bacterium]|nr:glycosyltransferase family 2 protein [Candidatus Dormibacteraeota bacterium]